VRGTPEHLLSLDLNLLEPLYALLEEKHVTRAAERCHLSQPAMSRALERLRATFKDELLVRAARAYARTAYGERLFSELQDIVPRLETALLDRHFEPLTSRHRFRLAATDFAANILMPELLELVAARAPSMTLSIVPFDDTSFLKVESGTVDLAIACGQNSPLLENELLFSDEFVCVTSVGNPLPERRVPLEDYVEQRHAVVEVARGCQPLIDGVLASRSCERRPAFRTTSHLSAALAAAKSGMVCTTARRLAVQFQTVANLRVFEAPLEFGKIEYVMAWHRRTRQDAAQSWLRDQIREVSQRFSNPSPMFGH
jgi:DNA-binding transcriptional LysR family regulator